LKVGLNNSTSFDRDPSALSLRWLGDYSELCSKIRHVVTDPILIGGIWLANAGLHEWCIDDVERVV